MTYIVCKNPQVDLFLQCINKSGGISLLNTIGNFHEVLHFDSEDNANLFIYLNDLNSNTDETWGRHYRAVRWIDYCRIKEVMITRLIVRVMNMDQVPTIKYTVRNWIKTYLTYLNQFYDRFEKKSSFLDTVQIYADGSMTYYNIVNYSYYSRGIYRGILNQVNELRQKPTPPQIPDKTPYYQKLNQKYINGSNSKK